MVGSVSHRCWVNISRGKGGRGRAVARPYEGVATMDSLSPFVG